MKARFELSDDVVKCIGFLRDRQRATYRELSQHIGRDVQRRDRYVLESARRKMESEGIVFVVETGIGLVRATDEQVARLSTSTPIEKIRRTTRRAKKREKLVNVQQLSDEDRLAFYIGRAVLGAIGQASRDAFRHQVTEAVKTNGNEPIDIASTLKLFANLRTQ